MLRDEFKERYTTIPFAIYRTHIKAEACDVLSHWHNEFELIAMTQGKAVFHIDSECFSASEGDVILIPPCSIHRVEIKPDGVTRYNCICFDTELLCDKELVKALSDGVVSAKSVVKADESYAKLLCEYTERACTACENGENGWELDAVGCMSLLFGALKKNSIFTRVLHNRKENDFGKNVIAYITENYSSKLTSGDVADAFFMNGSYFCRLFKKTFDCCFSDYILAYRIEKARLYLINTSMTVSQIAFQTGFNSSSYFGKAFKERYGVTPKQYREQNNYH